MKKKISYVWKKCTLNLIKYYAFYYALKTIAKIYQMAPKRSAKKKWDQFLSTEKNKLPAIVNSSKRTLNILFYFNTIKSYYYIQFVKKKYAVY